jgi:hypothetical protein
MPRGKRTVFAGFCKDCGRRTATIRLHKQKGTKTWKDFGPTKSPLDSARGREEKADKGKYLKFCRGCRKRTAVKLKEERHSSD